MDTLARLQARIASLDELRGLFGAMRALAASNVQAAQGALSGIRRYTSVIEESIAEAESILEGSGFDRCDPALPTQGVVIAVCSEHGFTGGFNARLMDRARQELAAGCRLAVIGMRGLSLAAEMGLEPAWSLAMPTHIGGVLGVARAVAARLAEFSDTRIVFARYAHGGHSEVERRQIIPLDPERLRSPRSNLPPLHHLPPALLLRDLISEYLLAEVTLALTESLASENGARLQIMEAADRTIGDKLDDLRVRERSLRQEAITAELLEVVTGAQAILDRDHAARAG